MIHRKSLKINMQTSSAPAESPRSASSPAKTPISSLQEICQRIGKTPQYDVMAVEGRAHQPQFVYRCTVGDIVRTGQGGSKKTAKHASAEAVLSALRAESEPSVEAVAEEPAGDAPPAVAITQEPDSDSSNPVGTLQELVVARGWRLPVYSLYAESGPAHKKEFVMCCAVETYKEYGRGTAKKHAKRNAALKMYNKIKALPPDEEPRLAHEVKSKLVSFDILYNSKGEKVQPLPPDENGDQSDNDACQHLQEIAEESDFSVEYHDIDQRTAKGEFQCLILLSTQPALCTHGRGRSCHEGRDAAAKHALGMLKIFSSRVENRKV